MSFEPLHQYLPTSTWVMWLMCKEQLAQVFAASLVGIRATMVVLLCVLWNHRVSEQDPSKGETHGRITVWPTPPITRWSVVTAVKICRQSMADIKRHTMYRIWYLQLDIILYYIESCGHYPYRCECGQRVAALRNKEKPWTCCYFALLLRQSCFYCVC